MAENVTLGRDRLGAVIQAARPGTTQNVAYTATAGVITNPVGSNLVQVYCTSDAFILFGSAPTATTANGTPVTANIPMTFKAEAGVDKVSAIQRSAAGTLYVTELY